MRSADLEQSIALVSEAFCHHRLTPVRAHGFRTTLEVEHMGSCPLARLSYDVPVTIDAERPRFLALMRCVRGAAHVGQGRDQTAWRQHQTLPVSPGLETRLRFDEGCIQAAVRLSPEQVERVCARWLGRPLDAPLRMSLAPFSSTFERAWQRGLEAFWSLEHSEIVVTDSVRMAFEDYLISLLLHNHPHNYSDALRRDPRDAEPALVARADRLMRQMATQAPSLSEIAETLGVSLRALQLAYKRARNTTPLAQFRALRLEVCRAALLEGGDRTSVSDVAMQYGFAHLGRFGAYYQTAFGESPSVTLRRARRGTPTRIDPARPPNAPAAGSAAALPGFR